MRVSEWGCLRRRGGACAGRRCPGHSRASRRTSDRIGRTRIDGAAWLRCVGGAPAHPPVPRQKKKQRNTALHQPAGAKV
eukprot:1195624-Prorocentrum_minimum.AAC.2